MQCGCRMGNIFSKTFNPWDEVVKDEIRALADRYADELKRSIDERVADMEQDDRSHVLIYEVLGISKDEGKLIDVYQNKGRFLYKYAGSFLEEAAKLCFKAKFPDRSE